MHSSKDMQEANYRGASELVKVDKKKYQEKVIRKDTDTTSQY